MVPISTAWVHCHVWTVLAVPGNPVPRTWWSLVLVGAFARVSSLARCCNRAAVGKVMGNRKGKVTGRLGEG